MSDNSEWKGGRVGPYELGRRFKDIPEDEGYLYEARHVETGEPALALMPASGDDWRLRVPWEVLTTNFIYPGVLIVHPKRREKNAAPPFHELALGYMRIAGTLASLDEREDVRAHCSHETRTPRVQRHAVRWGRVGAGMALAAALALLLWPRSPEHLETRTPPIDFPRLSDGEDLIPGVIAYPMPDKPFNEQAKPPCKPELEVEIRGGCWLPHVKTAPCPPGSAEYQGKCYVAVKKSERPPSSVNH